MTYEQLTIPGFENTESIPTQSRSCRQDFHASLTVLLEKVAAMVTSVTCGAKLSAVSAKLSRDGSSVKILPVCLPELVSGTSSAYLPTLPKWGIACRGEYVELAMSERLISEIECSYALLTPQASDTMRSNFKMESLAKRYMKHKGGNLAEQVGYMEMFPTPTICGNYNRKGLSKTSGNGLATVVKMFPTPLASERKHGKECNMG